MLKDKQEDEVENIFKPTILIPVVKYFETFINTRHNLGPDEFLKAIYVAEERRKSSNYSKTDNKLVSCALDPVKILPVKLQIPPVILQKPIAQLFFEIIRLKPFMLSLVHEFRKRRTRRDSTDMSQIIVITYVLIYRTSAATINQVIDCLIFFNASKMIDLLSFLLTPELNSWIYITGTEIFDIDFVEKKILEPFVKALPILQTIYTHLLETKRRKTITKKITTPIQLNVLKHPKKFPVPPACTPEKVLKIPVKPVPKTLYKQPDIESKIAILRQEHRLQAIQRLKDAQAPACFKTEKSKRYQKIIDEITKAKNTLRQSIFVKKIPTFTSMPVKKTVTTILREGARIANGEAKEVEKLKELMKGSFDPNEVQKMEDDMRQYEKKEELRKIEEKHLSGLISYEESILAKQQLIDEAKKQGDRVRLEREELNEKLEKYRLKEMEKLKRIVKKCHEAEQAAKNSYAFMIDEKRQKAAEVAEESRRMKVSLIKQKEEELRKKLQVIREIKTIQTMQGSRVKDFDPTETSKLGLMCEMSLAELRERLFVTKEKWQNELMARKETVKERRQKQKNLVECAQKTITEYRISKQSFQPSTSITSYDHSKVLQTPELLALREKLDNRRLMRLHIVNPTNENIAVKSKVLTK